MLKILTIGGATQDIAFQTKEGVLVHNQKDITRLQLLSFELGAKLNIKEANFSFGGGAANSAVNLSNLGNSVNALICVGADSIGQEIIKNLKQHKVKTNLTQIVDENSGLSFIVNAKNLANEHVLFTYRGANEAINVDLDSLTRNYKFDLIYLTSLSGSNSKNNLNKVFRYKNKYEQTKIVWNPGNEQIKSGLNGLKTYLKLTSILIINKDEAIEVCFADKKQETINNKQIDINERRANPRILLKKLSKYCPGIVVITDGENGAYCFQNNKIYYEPGLKIRVKDTTGVGDAFGSTFSWAINYTCGDIQKSLQLAIKNAGAVLEQVGAQQGLLSKTKLCSGI